MDADDSSPTPGRKKIDMQVLEKLLVQFANEFPTDEACFDELHRIAQIEIRCGTCAGRNMILGRNKRVGRCTQCHKDTWFTAGTILAHVKKPKPRLAAIWFAVRGVVFSSNIFARLFDIAQSTAHDILQWIRFANLNSMPQESRLLHSALFKSVFHKRSIETPARSHPRDEQDGLEKTAKIELSGGESPADDLFDNPSEQKVFNLLADKPIHFDKLLELSMLTFSALVEVLTMLELSGKIERVWGDSYRRSFSPPKLHVQLEKLQNEVSDFLDFIRVNFGGISRKYLQPYLASYWCNCKSTSVSTSEALNICFRSFPDANEKHRLYVTPLFVQIFSQGDSSNSKVPAA